MRQDRGFPAALIGDGRPLIVFTGLCLVLAGLFAVFLSVTLQFLPHDLRFLGMTADQLCDIRECRIVYFMFHNRVSLGGSVIAVGTLYLWLAEFPLRRGEAWSWWLLALSGIAGFGSILTFLGYGYLDTWHAIGTFVLAPCFVLGLARTRALLPRPNSPRDLLHPAIEVPWSAPYGIGRACLLATAFGLFAAGATILVAGTVWVFVPQDLAYLGMSTDELDAINPRLIPLLAHDRANFGGGVLATGLTMFFCVWRGTPSLALWQALCLSGAAGFTTALGCHPLIGYLDFVHLAPAVAGAAIFCAGLALTFGPMTRASGNESAG